MNVDPNCSAQCHGQGCQYCFTNYATSYHQDLDIEVRREILSKIITFEQHFRGTGVFEDWTLSADIMETINKNYTPTLEVEKAIVDAKIEVVKDFIDNISPCGGYLDEINPDFAPDYMSELTEQKELLAINKKEVK